jgi:hypothetical protein
MTPRSLAADVAAVGGAVLGDVRRGIVHGSRRFVPSGAEMHAVHIGKGGGFGVGCQTARLGEVMVDPHILIAWIVEEAASSARALEQREHVVYRRCKVL